MRTWHIHVRGLVQGVGFRPFVYRLATGSELGGEVDNRNDGVHIKVNADRAGLEDFIDLLKKKAPPASRIDSVEYLESEPEHYNDFSIKESENISEDITGVSPDIAVCNDCLEDLKKQPHRINYPLINCTNCGPRYSIIRDIPYDREKTTMSGFEMCRNCRREYTDVSDRRFHAQPVACNYCGPVYTLEKGELILEDINEIVQACAGLIDEGNIAAVKGSGGFHLVCDAHKPESVEELRRRKQRDGKPFAVMCRDRETALAYGRLDELSLSALTSWRAPVVIVDSIKDLASGVCNGLGTIGIVLPYMPFHYMLFEKLRTDVLVFTSANLSEEPVITGNDEARKKLNGIADFFIMYNREIHNRTDDSVMKRLGDETVILRRARGFTPSAVSTRYNTEGIFAAGSELVNSFAIGRGSDVILSQHIGDLKNIAASDFYEETFALMSRLFRFEPELIVRDMHPDYLSSVFADRLAAEKGIRVLEVQHHHAHLASCMAENNVDEPVIGLSLDGVGLGSDGKIWGGEIMIADYKGFRRVYHFDYVPIMGADNVSDEPWRSGISYLVKYMGGMSAFPDLPFLEQIETNKLDLYLQGLEKRINTHEYSSAGRLFDAIAAICNINLVSDFHAEAPMRLEAVAEKNITGSYDYLIGDGVISYRDTIATVCNDVKRGESPGIISARFHNTVIGSLEDVVERVSEETGIKKVAMSGGTFQNNYLISVLKERLKKKYDLYLHRQVPPNDGGLALGQLVIAAQKR